MLFQQSATIEVFYQKNSYSITIHKEHFLLFHNHFRLFCDRYGNAGMSRTYGGLQFRFEGKIFGQKNPVFSASDINVYVQASGTNWIKCNFKILDLDNLEKKELAAINFIQTVAGANNQKPVEVAFSGGKDSLIALHLVRRAGIPHRVIHKCTTIDVPGTLKIVTDNNAEVVRPRFSFAQLIAKKGFPSKKLAFCCEQLKEYKILDKAVLGIRQCESVKRAKYYEEPTSCRIFKNGDEVEQILPILKWSDSDILNYIEKHRIKLHPLYYNRDGSINPKARLGCMCCPKQGYRKRINAFLKYPRMVKFYLRAGQEFLNSHPNSVVHQIHGSDVYQWFARDLFYPENKKWSKIKDIVHTLNFKELLEDYFHQDLTLTNIPSK